MPAPRLSPQETLRFLLHPATLTKAEALERADAEVLGLKSGLQDLLPTLPRHRRSLHLAVRQGRKGGFSYTLVPPDRHAFAPRGGVLVQMNQLQFQRLKHRATERGHATMIGWLRQRCRLVWRTVRGHGPVSVAEDRRGNITVTASPRDTATARRLAHSAGQTDVCRWLLHTLQTPA